MSTGPKHQRFIVEKTDQEGRQSGHEEDCRCMIGEDHHEDGDLARDADDGDDESLSVYDAADIWLSNGMDEDYMFGYTASELRTAANSN